jgi:hypothetical protein
MDQEFLEFCKSEECQRQLNNQLAGCGPAPPPPNRGPSEDGPFGAMPRRAVGGWEAWVPLMLDIITKLYDQWKRTQTTTTSRGQQGEGGQLEGGQGGQGGESGQSEEEVNPDRPPGFKKSGGEGAPQEQQSRQGDEQRPTSEAPQE